MLLIVDVVVHVHVTVRLYRISPFRYRILLGAPVPRDFDFPLPCMFLPVSREVQVSRRFSAIRRRPQPHAHPRGGSKGLSRTAVAVNGKVARMSYLQMMNAQSSSNTGRSISAQRPEVSHWTDVLGYPDDYCRPLEHLASRICRLAAQ